MNKSLIATARAGAAPRGRGAAPAGEKPPPPPFVAYEPITGLCGHTVPFGLWPDGKDPHRDQRRTRLAGKVCLACRERRFAEDRRRGQERRRRERAALREAGRLPHGSSFLVEYNAPRVCWAGILEVPCANGPPASFTGEAGTVFMLLSALDRQYRVASAPANAAAGAGKPEASGLLPP
jgi:hypothetical protein